jgi:hypothetical protein
MATRQRNRVGRCDDCGKAFLPPLDIRWLFSAIAMLSRIQM